METFQQPKITGYRQLNEQDVELMNQIKQKENELGQLIQKMRDNVDLDQRWVSIGVTHCQQGFMALVRSVAQPTSELR